MTSDESALLAAACAHPDDDAPRSAYADWLEDHGEPARAEFIRVQCELARLPKRSQRRKALASREAELLWQFEGEWLTRDLTACGLWDLLPADVESLADKLPAFGFWFHRFERGFVAELRGSAESLLEAAPCLDRLPPLGTLFLAGFGRKTLAGLLRRPGMAHVRVLRLHPWDDFGSNRLGDAGVAALAGSSNLPRLASLSLGDNEVTDAGVAELAASPRLPALEELYLDGNDGIGPAGAWALARSPNLARLRFLDLGGTGVPEEDPAANALRQRFGKKVSF